MPERPIYLDHHATTPVDPRVLECMLPYFREQFGNAASLNHVYGRAARDAVEAARDELAAVLRCQPREITFTSGATEANNLALKGIFAGLPSTAHLVVSAVEHRSVLDPAARLERQRYAVTRVPVDSFGRVHPDAVSAAIRPETGLVSVMWANNEVGTINPIAEIAAVCRARNVLLHCDAVQALGRLPIDLEQVPADLVSLSAHKVYGPQGVGALYVRRGPRRIVLTPQIDGGGHEQGRRSGTLPVPLIVGFGAACRMAEAEREREQPRLATLRVQLWEAIRTRIPDAVLHGDPEKRLAGNLHVGFPDVDGDALLTGLTKIAVSSGSACTTAAPEPSHVLRAMGVADRLSRASLRFGLGRETTNRDISSAATHVADVVERLRRQMTNDK